MTRIFGKDFGNTRFTGENKWGACVCTNFMRCFHQVREEEEEEEEEKAGGDKKRRKKQKKAKKEKRKKKRLTHIHDTQTPAALTQHVSHHGL